MDEKIKSEEAVFCVPSLPPPLPLAASLAQKQIRSNEPQLSLTYTPPNWSSKPPLTIGENILDEEGFCNHYFLEVIKSGSVVDNIKLNKEFISFGRLDQCDVLCEHPSLSRFHAILQYSNGDEDKNYPEGYYIIDLGSTHGTFLNKIRIEPNKYVRVNVESMIKFGLSTRLYLLHGPKSKNNSDDLKINLTHEQMRRIKDKYDQISIKLKVRKEIEEEEKLEEERIGTKNRVTWGMSENVDEENNPDEENPFAVIEEEDESFYSADPRKALKNFFDREGEELDYEIEELSIGKFKCTIQLPIQNNYGSYMIAEVQHDGKKKECMTLCALEACRILNAEGVLKSSRKDSIKKKKNKDWETADYYDSDEDTYLDRTGDVEKKRLQRMAQAGKLTDEKNAPTSLKNKIHTFDSILHDIKTIMCEKFEIDKKLETCKAAMKAVQDDDLDSYIESLKVGTIDTVTRAKMKRRLVEINSELHKLEKMLNVSKTSNFDVNKWKTEVLDQFENRASTTILSHNSKETIQPIVVEETKFEEIKKTEPEIRKTQKISKKSEAKSEILQTDETKTSTIKRKEQIDQKTQEENHLSEPGSHLSLKTNNKKQKLKNTDKFNEDYVDSKDYAVWIPPPDQKGDGKTKLNEKFGY